MHSAWWLVALIVTPLVGGLFTVGLKEASRVIAVLTLVVELALAVYVTVAYSWSGGVGPHGTVDFAHRWVVAKPLGLAADVGVDGVSLLLVVLTPLVVLLAVLGARDERREPAFLGWLLLLTSATVGSFVSRDLLEFFLFFELTLIPSYFLIAQWGGVQRTRAALKFFIYTLAGSGFLLVGLIYLASVHHEQFGGQFTFAYDALIQTHLAHATAVWIFVAFALAFAVKSPIWPFHTWSPLAYAEAPIAGSMVLSALLAKLGTYGLLRFAVGLLPQAVHTVSPYLMTLAVIGILYGSALAAVQNEMKRLVAYSSLAQVGFIVLGIASGSAIATSGAVLLMFNHGVITAAFFLLIGGLERRRGTSLISDLTGLQRPAPVLAALFTVVMLASIGLPGLSGFVSEYLVLLGTFGVHPWWAVVATTGVIFAALYLLWAYQRVFHGDAQGANAEIADASGAERWVLAPLIALIVVLGVYPKPALDRIAPSTHAIVATVSSEGVNR